MVVMNRAKFEVFRNLVSGYIEDNDENIRESYSGRGMYGSDCLGVVVSNNSDVTKVHLIMALVMEMDEEEPSDPKFSAEDVLDVLDSAPAFTTDNMGYDIIVYWRGITVEKEDEDN